MKKHKGEPMPKAAPQRRQELQQATSPHVLEINAGKIHVMTPTVPTQDDRDDATCPTASSSMSRRSYVLTNMGRAHLDDGSVERADLDGKNRKVIVPVGNTHTPKQIILDKAGGKL